MPLIGTIVSPAFRVSLPLFTSVAVHPGPSFLWYVDQPFRNLPFAHNRHIQPVVVVCMNHIPTFRG